MDLSLRDYLKYADVIHDDVFNFGAIMPLHKLEDYVHKLQTDIKNLQAIAVRLADVSNVVNNIIIHRKRPSFELTESDNIDDIKDANHANHANSANYTIDIYPNNTDYAVLKAAYPFIKNIKSVAGSQLEVYTVDNLCDIPMSNIFYISSLNQYAINIMGVVIKGNLANITNENKYSTRCYYGVNCRSLINKKCNYYHDPEDYINKNLSLVKNTRNFTPGSWIYANTFNKKNTNNKYKSYRHVGSADTLNYDIFMLKQNQYKEEINNREGQLIHDLLIYLILHKNGLLEKYKSW